MPLVTAAQFGGQPNIQAAIQAGQRTRAITQEEANRQRLSALAQQQLETRQRALGVSAEVPTDETQTAAQFRAIADDPALAKQFFETAGIDTEAKREEAAAFAFNVRNAPEDQKNELINQRVLQITSRGGDPKDTLELLDAPPALRDTILKGVEAAALTAAQRQIGAGGKIQFGGQETFKDEKGNLFFGTTKRNPATGVVESVLAPIGGGEAKPVGGVSVVSAAGLTPTEKVKQAVDIQQQTGDVETKQAIEKQTALELTSEEKKQVIKLTKLKIKESQFKEGEERQLAKNVKETRRNEALNATSVVNRLLSDDRFTSGFGRLATVTPATLKSQQMRDVDAEVDQVVNLIGLEARKKLKGQGTVSDSEAEALAKSATILANRLISDEAARRELTRVRGVFEDAAARNQLEKPTREEERQSVQQQAQLPQGVTEEDITETMRANNMTRQQVLDRLGSQ